MSYCIKGFEIFWKKPQLIPEGFATRAFVISCKILSYCEMQISEHKTLLTLVNKLFSMK